MKKDTKDIGVSPVGFGMTLEDLLREGMRDLIEKAVTMESSELLAGYESVRTLQGQQAVVRNGYLGARRVIDADRAGECADPEGARPLWG